MTVSKDCQPPTTPPPREDPYQVSGKTLGGSFENTRQVRTEVGQGAGPGLEVGDDLPTSEADKHSSSGS